VAKFTRKPATVEAFQFTGWTSCFHYMPDWFMKKHPELGDPADGLAWESPGANLLYETLEPHPHIACILTTSRGTVRVEVCDWIVKDETGEVWAYKPEIFAVMFEEVNEQIQPGK
jgi:hypothetical protein